MHCVLFIELSQSVEHNFLLVLVNYMINKEILHITNDYGTAEKIRQAGINGDVLPWWDTLYEGPVLPIPLEQLSKIRADYFADIGIGEYSELVALFKARNQAIRRFRKYREVVLWFDHDLRDQLQLVQLLNWFSQQTLGQTRLSLININRYAGIAKFHGFESLRKAHFKRLFGSQLEVSVTQLEMARFAWDAVCSSNPLDLLSFVKSKMECLPYLQACLMRFLDEYPSRENGLSRTEYHILSVINRGFHAPLNVFAGTLNEESAHFHDETLFWFYLNRMIYADAPLILIDGKVEGFSLDEKNDLRRLKTAKIAMTQLGLDVLYQHADFLQRNNINRWIGGVHLTEQNIWRRNTRDRALKRTYA